jgi:hypothetical protein
VRREIPRRLQPRCGKTIAMPKLVGFFGFSWERGCTFKRNPDVSGQVAAGALSQTVYADDSEDASSDARRKADVRFGYGSSVCER